MKNYTEQSSTTMIPRRKIRTTPDVGSHINKGPLARRRMARKMEADYKKLVDGLSRNPNHESNDSTTGTGLIGVYHPRLHFMLKRPMIHWFGPRLIKHAILALLGVFGIISFIAVTRVWAGGITNGSAMSNYPMRKQVDTFKTYKFRNNCNISSLDLHMPLNPLCSTRKELLNAVSSGGRIGFDSPYVSRGCDMRWFTTAEICEILGRFDRVILIGDSMMRHVAGSFNIFTRMDLGYGAVTDWNFSNFERRTCFCNNQFDAKSCSVQGIYQTSDVLKHDLQSLACTSSSINVITELITRYPIPKKELNQLTQTISFVKTDKPIAFILGHGLWNDLDVQKTVDWTDQIMNTIIKRLPELAKPGAFFPRLFVTPNASGKQKSDDWLVSQGNKALMLFEEAIGIEAAKRGIEHLGTWNMSIQATKYDGTHLDMKGNLVKAMMVLNWLNMLPVQDV